MAAYYAVEVSLNTNAVEVGIPSPQSVNVTIPNVGPAGPKGDKGDKGDPGDIGGSLDWANITSKPSTFPPSAHTHVAADVTDFATAVAAVSPPVDWNSLTGKPATFAPSAHTHPISEVTNLQTALDGKAASSHAHALADITDAGTAAAVEADQDLGTTNSPTFAAIALTNTSADGDNLLGCDDQGNVYRVTDVNFNRLAAYENLGLGTLATINNPLTTAGDLLVGGTAGAPSRLAIGTASQQLRVNSGATALEYFTQGNMTAATTSAAGASGLVPAPAAGIATRTLHSNGLFEQPASYPAYKADGSGVWVRSPMSESTGQTTTGAVTGSLRRFLLMYAPADGTIDLLGLRYPSAPTTAYTVNLAIWEMGENGFPAARVDGGNISILTGVANTEYTLVVDAPIKRGYFWISHTANSTQSTGTFSVFSFGGVSKTWWLGSTASNNASVGNTGLEYTCATAFDQSTHESSFTPSSTSLPQIAFQYA